jgi:hypothetical protein
MLHFMKNSTIVSVIFLLLFVPNIKTQTVAPLELGNVWIYDYTFHLSKSTVVDTNVLIDTILYYKVKTVSNYGTTPTYGYARLREDGFYAVRYDTSYPAPDNEFLYYKDGAIIGDTWENPGPDFPIIYSVLDTIVTNVLGNLFTVKHLTVDDGLIFLDEYWTDELGWLRRSDIGGSLGALRGCVIDGIVYGDTSFIVTVENEFQQPTSFILYQNYPNPFNHASTIKYTLSERSFVTIKVYDVLGNEISTLVNDEKPAGEYEVEFNGHSGVVRNLTSGTYFYQLKTENYIETKKMILLK